MYCDQRAITSQEGISPEDVKPIVEKHLATINRDGAVIEAGFFGGTFTALDKTVQTKFLEPLQEFMANNSISGIRLSTRPDCISEDVLTFLKGYGVKTIELGVQSMSDTVLAAVKRGYTAEDVRRSSESIVRRGFTLVHQMMVGLPESTFDDEYCTVKEAALLGAGEIRIYPTIVVKNTELAKSWEEGKYHPLPEGEAVKRCVKLMLFLNEKNIRVIRCGLHPSENLISHEGYLAGPFHPAFRQKVDSGIFALVMEKILASSGEVTSLAINPEDECAFYGYGGSNVAALDKIFSNKKRVIVKDTSVARGVINIKW
ncbi:MAG: radical SAM protein [Candidatus Omnitrophica bacterium]|nr:radical SAM protein [Candidatus Omnitrophota bacterium]